MLGFRLVEVLKPIANQSGSQLLTAKVHHGDYVHVFVSASPVVGIPEVVHVLKCNSASCCLKRFRIKAGVLGWEFVVGG
jgi:REP element-mobilizing transposase RayT